MKKSNNKKTRDVTAFIYPRLSRDDNLEGESYSIGNQKKLLTKMAKDMGYDAICYDYLGIPGILSPDKSEILPAALNGSLWVLFQETINLLQFLL